MSIAQEIVDGEICAGCQMPFTKSHGYPVVCPECKEEGWTGYEDAIYPIDRGKREEKMKEGGRMKYIKVCDEGYQKIKEQYNVSVVDYILAENIEWLDGQENWAEMGKKRAWREAFEEWKEELHRVLSKEQIKDMGQDLIDMWAMKLCIWFGETTTDSFDFEIDDGEGDGYKGCISEPDGISMSYTIDYGC